MLTFVCPPKYDRELLMKRLVITTHGIRTFGDWQERLEQLLRNSRIPYSC